MAGDDNTSTDQDKGTGQDAGPPTDNPTGETGGQGGTPSEADLPDWARNALQKARREAAGYRTKVRELEPLAKKATQLEDAGKTELERLTGDRDGHRNRADKAEALATRLQVALDRAPEHATIAHIKAVAKRLTGDTPEELGADAEELFTLLAPAPTPASTAPRVPGRPTERITPRGGSNPDEPAEETDPRKLAASIPRPL